MTNRKKILIAASVLLPVLVTVAFSFLEIEKQLQESFRFVILFYSLIIFVTLGFTGFILSEINRRKRNETDLRAYTDLVEYTQTLVRQMDGTIINWNKGMERLYGWTKEQAIGKSSHQLFATVFPQSLADIEQSLLQKDSWQGELQHTRQNGDIIFVTSHWSLIRNEDGSPAAVVESYNDITEQKKIEEEVKLLSRQVSQSNNAIYSIDSNYKITTWNIGAEKLYEFSAEEALGHNPNRLLQTALHADELKQIYLELKQQGHWQGETKRKTKTGKAIYVYVSLSTICNHDGSFAGYISVSHDITERIMLSEQVDYLASLVEQCTDAIVSVAPNGTILSWNNAATLLYGYEAHEAIARNISMIVPLDLANDEQVIIGQIKKGLPVHQYETQRLRKDGTRFDVSLSLSVVKDAQGVIISVSGIARNISERKEAERKIIQSEENLQAVFENASESFILTDNAGIVKAINRRAQRRILNNMQGIIEPGTNLYEFIDPSRTDSFKKIFEEVLKGNTIRYDRAHTGKDGKTTWMNFTYNPVKNEQSEIVGTCIAGLDITETKIAEQQREFDRNNLNALINNTRDLMWSVDRNFLLITSNQAFDDMTRIMAGKIIEKGSNILDWQFDEKMQQRYKQFYERAFAGEAFTEIEYTLTSFEYWGENSFYPIYEGDQVVGTACFSRNITRQKKAEEQLQNSFDEKWALAERMSAILNTLPANIALLNNKGIIIDVNNAWRDFANENGFQGSQYGIGQNYISIAEKSACNGETDGAVVAAGVRQVIENKIDEFILEYPCHSEKLKKWFRMVVTPLRDKEYEGAVVMHIDISKLKELEWERLQGKMNEQKKITRAILQAQEKERNELGRELHDNICQILAAVKMKLTFCSSNHAVSLPFINEAISHLNEAVNETRNLSHRMLMPRFAERSLADALVNLANTYTHDKRTVTLNTTDDEEKNIPPPVKETLYRIAQEQLHNIEKYARASAVMLHINSDAELITMSIEDNGIGFDTKKKRSGVGLTNIRNRTESFNGSVRIISAKGEGCLLMVEIPLAEK